MGIQDKPLDNSTTYVKHKEWLLAKLKENITITGTSIFSTGSMPREKMLKAGETWGGKLAPSGSIFLIRWKESQYYPIPLSKVDVFFRKVTETTTIHTTIVDQLLTTQEVIEKRTMNKDT